MTSLNSLLAVLARLGVVSAKDLERELGVSQPTVSRLITQAGEHICRLGQARGTRYARTRELPGLGTRLPLHRIRETGEPEHFGTLYLLAHGRHWLVTRDDTGTLFEGLPPFASDMSPQGYIGREFSVRHPELELPHRLSDWTDDHRLIALARRGEDCVGNLILGDESMSRWLEKQHKPVPRTSYVEFARLSAQKEVGSSAGGEQPKFLTYSEGRHVLVKFVGDDAGMVSRRWMELLVCESLALQSIREAGLEAATAHWFDAKGYRFLEVERFDRVGELGRRRMLSLEALDNELIGDSGRGASWTKTSLKLMDRGLISSVTARRIRWLDVFGQLIGNTDRHFGNLSFLVMEDESIRLAPAYDMLPMLFAPAGTMVIRRLFEPAGPTPETSDIWLDAAQHACQFWFKVAFSEGEALSDEFQLLAMDCLNKLAAKLPEKGSSGNLAQVETSLHTEEFLRRFFRAVIDRPIEFTAQDEQRYVRIYDDPAFAEHDPVQLLASSITLMAGQSVQLLSGSRGTGKSTELRRLRRKLEGLGTYKVALVDIEDYLNLSQPMEVSDLLMAVAGGLGDALLEEGHLEGDSDQEGYWARLLQFLERTRIQFDESSEDLNAGTTTTFMASLKNSPLFRETLQKNVAGHLGTLVRDVGVYIEECVQKVKMKYGPDTEVVLLVDSLEHIRGVLTNATAVRDSVVSLFVKHGDQLRFNQLHVVYTVPPFLQFLQPDLGALYQPGGVQVIPTLNVYQRGAERRSFQPALDVMEKLILKRGDWQRLLGADARETVDELSLLSGGNLRDFLRLFAEIIRRADRLPVHRRVVQAAIQQIRSEFLPIADDDALWLDRIAHSNNLARRKSDESHTVIHYLDSNLVLNYRNGEDWWDVHPLVRDAIQQQALSARERWGSDLAEE